MECEFSTKSFSYNKGTKIMTAESSTLGLTGFPKSFNVRSEHTNKVITFIKDVEAGIANEFWDGELCEYVPFNQHEVPNVVKIVIINN